MFEQDSALIKVQDVMEDFMIQYFSSIYRVRCYTLHKFRGAERT